MIRSLIPKYVKNKTFIRFYDLLRKWQKLLKKDYSHHLKENEEAFLKHVEEIKKNKGYIEDQNAYVDMRFGKTTVQYAGCEIIAVYNAMIDLMGKCPFSFSEMVASFENDGMVCSGKLGSSTKAIVDYLDKNGFKTCFSTNMKDCNSIAETYETMILTMYNDATDISKEVHTIQISKRENGFVAHNVYCNGKTFGPFSQPDELIQNINHGKAKGIAIIGVSCRLAMELQNEAVRR